jgi:esterase/lipase
MAFDYSKSKSYQKIVSKAKSYSSKGKSSLKAQQQRMKERRAITTPILKDLGIKKLREINEGGISAGVKWMKENREQANKFRTALETIGRDNNSFVEYESMMAALKKDNPVDMEKAYLAEEKKQKAIRRKRSMNNYGREFYAKTR